MPKKRLRRSIENLEKSIFAIFFGLGGWPPYAVLGVVFFNPLFLGRNLCDSHLYPISLSRNPFSLCFLHLLIRRTLHIFRLRFFFVQLDFGCCIRRAYLLFYLFARLPFYCCLFLIIIQLQAALFHFEMRYVIFKSDVPF